MSKKDFSVALKYVEARPRSQRRKGAEARVSGISVVGSGASATDLSLLQANLISVTNNFTALKDLFDSMFEKDSDGNIHAKLSLWSSGGITAGGVGSGGSGGGGGISYSRLDSWSDYSADKSGWVLSALLGNDLNNRLTSVENAGYVTASTLAPYALRSEIPSLVGYATESFVTSQGYITASALGGYATQSWVESKNYLTGITSSMVTTALGYTPYNSANFTKANIKSTLRISDWALESVKPTYTASEVGALGVNDTAANANKLGGLPPGYRKGNDCIPAITSTGVMEIGKFIDFHTTDEEVGVDYSLRVECQGGYRNRVYFPTVSGTIALTSDIPTKLSQLTDDVVAGKYLPLSGGTLSGSNRDLLSLDTSNTSGPRITLYENGNLIALIGCVPKQTTTDYGAYFVNVSSKFGVILGNDKKAYITLNTDTMSKDYQILHSGNYADYALSKYGGTVKGSITASSFIGNLTGNAGSATKLATSRTIWGQSFDGTGNISGDLIGDIWRILKDQIWDGLFIQSKNYAGTSDLGNIFITAWNANELSSFNVWANKSIFTGNVAIGGKTADEKFHVHGNGKFTGALTANSLTIGGITLTYDSVNEALCINGNMYALGGITAGGAGISAYTSLEARVARLEQQLNIS